MKFFNCHVQKKNGGSFKFALHQLLFRRSLDLRSVHGSPFDKGVRTETKGKEHPCGKLELKSITMQAVHPVSDEDHP